MRVIMAMVLGAAGLAGCASKSEPAPAWLAEREASIEQSYPSLRDVPRGSDANTNSAHWSLVERELLAAGEAVRASPRSQPASATETPTEFLSQAREELEKSRDSHQD
jgi:hypothetical protein